MPLACSSNFLKNTLLIPYYNNLPPTFRQTLVLSRQQTESGRLLARHVPTRQSCLMLHKSMLLSVTRLPGSEHAQYRPHSVHFSTSSLDEGEWSAQRSDCLYTAKCQLRAHGSSTLLIHSWKFKSDMFRFCLSYET
jgi:hypothetical protein